MKEVTTSHQPAKNTPPRIFDCRMWNADFRMSTQISADKHSWKFKSKRV